MSVIICREDAADRFGVHNDEIGVHNLDVQELEPANDEQAHEPEAEDDAKWQLQDVNQAQAARDRGNCLTYVLEIRYMHQIDTQLALLLTMRPKIFKKLLRMVRSCTFL